MKLTQDELSQVNSLGEQYSRLFAAIGRIEVKIKEYAMEKDVLHSQYSLLLGEEEKLTKSLEDKYGQGSIDLSTGEVTPIA